MILPGIILIAYFCNTSKKHDQLIIESELRSSIIIVVFAYFAQFDKMFPELPSNIPKLVSNVTDLRLTAIHDPTSLIKASINKMEL